MRTRIATALTDAMKAKDATRLSTLRLVQAAIKDRDICLRTDEGHRGCEDEDIRGILAKMVKQREESARIYEEAGRLELAEQERSEIKIIREFMPKPLSEGEMESAISRAIKKTGAGSIRDMGRVMACLKADFQGRMDFAKASGKVKTALG